MEKKQIRYSFAVRGVSGMLLAFAFAYAVSQFFTLQVPIYFLLAAVAGLEALAVWMDAWKKKVALWVSLGLLVLVLVHMPVFFGIRIPVFFAQASAWIRDSFYWLEQYQASLDSQTAMEPEFWRCLFLSGLSVIAATAVFYPLTKYYPSRLVLAALLLGAFLALTVMGYDINKVSLACVCIYLCSVVLELCNRQMDRQRTEKKPYSALFLYPVCILLSLCVIFLPSKEDPIQWTAVRRLLDGIHISMDAVTDRLQILFGQVPADFTIGFDNIAFFLFNLMCHITNYFA